MLKPIGPVKNCCFTNNGLPIDKICHPNLESVFHPHNPHNPISVNFGISLEKFRAGDVLTGNRIRGES
jgi:hypothetical protein